MFEFFKPKAEAPVQPKYEDLLQALPEDLQAEYQALTEKIVNMAGSTSGMESEIMDDELSIEDKQIMERHDELQNIALQNMKK